MIKTNVPPENNFRIKIQGKKSLILLLKNLPEFYCRKEISLLNSTLNRNILSTIKMSGYVQEINELGESKKFKIFRYMRNEDIHNEDILMSIRLKNCQKSTLFTQDYNSKKNYDNKRLDLKKKIR